MNKRLNLSSGIGREAKVGWGDELIGSGLARGAKARGKRIAFGDGKTISWRPYAYEIYKNNPNVAPPGSEGADDLEWIAHTSAERAYNKAGKGRWIWKEFTPIPGEIYFDKEELDFGKRFGSGFIVIEPNIPKFKSVANNKRWPFERWQIVANQLIKEGHEVVQFRYSGGNLLSGVRQIKTPSFRKALAALSHAKLFMGCEGGLHHGAASSKFDSDCSLLVSGIPAVVLFGGFIHPRTTGYSFHSNIFTGSGWKNERGEEAGCGSLNPCEHCKEAMRAITPEMVLKEASKLLA